MTNFDGTAALFAHKYRGTAVSVSAGYLIGFNPVGDVYIVFANY